MRFIDGIPVWGEPVDDSALKQIKRCTKGAEKVALMADHDLGYSVPIGGVVAYENKVSPAGVGYDIACGNKAVLVDADTEETKKNISNIMDDVFRRISFGVGQKNRQTVDHELFDDPVWKMQPVSELKDLAREQLGTVGSGNHYIDIFDDEQKRIWVGVHFGSRGLGHRTATHFLKAAGAKDAIHAEPTVHKCRFQPRRRLCCVHEFGGKIRLRGQGLGLPTSRQYTGREHLGRSS